MSETVRDILVERGKRYGEFKEHARCTMNLKIAFSDTLNKTGNRLEDYQREALDMICHKIGRIVNGDPNYIDSWQDIAGYAQLVVDILKPEATPNAD